MAGDEGSGGRDDNKGETLDSAFEDAIAKGESFAAGDYDSGRSWGDLDRMDAQARYEGNALGEDPSDTEWGIRNGSLYEDGMFGFGAGEKIGHRAGRALANAALGPMGISIEPGFSHRTGITYEPSFNPGRALGTVAGLATGVPGLGMLGGMAGSFLGNDIPANSSSFQDGLDRQGGGEYDPFMPDKKTPTMLGQQTQQAQEPSVSPIMAPPVMVEPFKGWPQWSGVYAKRPWQG